MSRLRRLVEAWLAGERRLAPIADLLGIRPLTLADGTAQVEMAADARWHNAMGTVHGGVFCDLADVAMGTALATVTEDGESFATLQLQMSYFQPVREGRLIASARLLRRGRTTAYLECDVHDADGELVAKATSVVMIRPVGGLPGGSDPNEDMGRPRPGPRGHPPPPGARSMSPPDPPTVTENLRAMSRASDLDPTRRLAYKVPMTKEAVTRRLRLQSRLRDACLAWGRLGVAKAERPSRLAGDAEPTSR